MILHCLNVHTPNNSVDGTCDRGRSTTRESRRFAREVIVQAMITLKVMASNTANKQTNEML